jgi:serine/threonine-protein kinase RsbW
MTGDYLLEGLAVPESLNLLHDLLDRVGREHPEISPADLMLFETAVIEVAGNVVEHGKPHGHVAWPFPLEVLGGTWGTTMPADPMQEDGRGLALATAVLDALTYERRDHVNHWRMVRERP